ncbi:MAG: WD40/YVTN/BNR-like repeat-containing protein [Chloroflexota bacterium]
MSTNWERVAANTGGTVGGMASALVDGRPHVYAATPVGVYRSSDSGQTWMLSGIRNSVPFAELVVPSARFEHDRTLFVCAGDGLYRSSDGGQAWQPVLLGSRMLSVASADVGEGSVLLAGTEADGILRSEDGGRTWEGANAGLLDLAALAIGVSPQFASDRLAFAGTASGLYRTRNRAKSWREIETGLTEPAVQCVAISPMFPDDRIVLAGTEADGLLRSNDGGGTWHRPPSLVGEGVTAIAFSRHYPSKPMIAAAIESGIAVSDDAGRTWRRSSSAPTGVVLSLLFVPAGAGEVLLAGLHRLGIARSTDGGATWDLANEGLNARLVTGLVLSPAFARDQTMFVSGPQDGVSVSTDGGRSWTERNQGLDDPTVVALAVSPAYARDRTVYVASPTGIHVSHDGAATWVPSSTAPARTVATVPTSTPLPIRSPPSPGPDLPPTVVAALSDGRLVASDDGVATWRVLAGGPDAYEILTLALSPGYALDRTLWMASRQPASGSLAEVVVWRSRDAGERWDRWLAERQDGQPFIALAVPPGAASDELIFVGMGARVFRPVRHAHEVRAGRRRPIWRAVDLAAGAAGVTAMVVSPSYGVDRTLFVATNAGVFVSRDAGQTYQPWSEGLDPPGMVALAISPDYRTDRVLYGLGLGGTIWRRHDTVSKT